VERFGVRWAFGGGRFLLRLIEEAGTCGTLRLLSMLSRHLLLGWGAENADEGLSDLGLVGPLDGRPVCYGPSHGCACRSGYTDWGEQAGPLGAFVALEVFLVGHCTSVMDVRDERRVWITCQWPNPSFQLTTRGSAVTARAFQAPSVAGSPHRRPRSPSRRDGEKCA